MRILLFLILLFNLSGRAQATETTSLKSVAENLAMRIGFMPKYTEETPQIRTTFMTLFNLASESPEAFPALLDTLQRHSDLLGAIAVEPVYLAIRDQILSTHSSLEPAQEMKLLTALMDPGYQGVALKAEVLAYQILGLTRLRLKADLPRRTELVSALWRESVRQTTQDRSRGAPRLLRAYSATRPLGLPIGGLAGAMLETTRLPASELAELLPHIGALVQGYPNFQRAWLDALALRLKHAREQIEVKDAAKNSAQMDPEKVLIIRALENLARSFPLDEFARVVIGENLNARHLTARRKQEIRTLLAEAERAAIEEHAPELCAPLLAAKSLPN